MWNRSSQSWGSLHRHRVVTDEFCDAQSMCSLTRTRRTKNYRLRRTKKNHEWASIRKAPEPTRRHNQAATSCWLGTLAAFLASLVGCLCGGQSGPETSSTPVFRFYSVSVIPPNLHTHTSFFYKRSNMGWDSSVSIATRYGLDGPGIESQCGRDFPHPSRPALGHIQPPIQWVPGLSRGQSGRDVALTSHPI